MKWNENIAKSFIKLIQFNGDDGWMAGWMEVNWWVYIQTSGHNESMVRGTNERALPHTSCLFAYACLFDLGESKSSERQK